VNLRNNLTYYLAAIIVFVLLKFYFSSADNDSLIFLLKPTDFLTGLVTGSNSVYISEIGFYYEKLNIIIDKSCSGYNFWLLSFLMLFFLTIKYFNNHFHKILVIPSCLLFAGIFTIFINTSRILITLIFQQHIKNLLPDNFHFAVHESLGVITYLSFLIIIYLIAEKLLNKTFPHAEST
jgi:exosortase K